MKLKETVHLHEKLLLFLGPIVSNLFYFFFTFSSIHILFGSDCPNDLL
jgi:hypothetical protein